MDERDFDGRCAIGGGIVTTSIRCKRCSKILTSAMILEGQVELNNFLKNIDSNEVYLIPGVVSEVKDGEYTLLKGTGLIKCPDCFYVNEVKVNCAKNVKENAYKNF